MTRPFGRFYSPNKIILSLIFTAVFLGYGCSSTETLNHPTTNATLWMQNAAEYSAITTLVYQTASSNVNLALEDSHWSAAVEQNDTSRYRSLPPAVILDVDETVLDNSPFQARMIRQDMEFNFQHWQKWVREEQADAIPGALAFTRYAAGEGAEIIYLTNREHAVEEATRKNLKKLGFPVSEEQDLVLTKNEKKNWTSDKSARRAFIAENFRVIMIIGDNLNDFVPAKNITREKRKQLVDQYRSRWGRQWYLLPNPVYGSWEQALYNFNDTLTVKQIEDARLNQLNAKQ